MEGLELKDALTGILTDLVNFAVDLVPRLVTGIVVLVIGVIIAKVVEILVRGLLTRLKFDSLLERVGVTEILAGLGVKGQLSRGIPRLLYFLLLIIFIQGASDAVGLAVVSNGIAAFFAFLPRLVSAVLILVLGNSVAKTASRAVEESGRESGVDYAPAMGRAVAGAITFIVTIMAISQLGIDTDMIRIVVIAGLAGASLALALSFGIGSREVTRNLIAGFYLRKLLRVGDEIEALDHRGVVSGITPTKTLLDEDGKTVTLANSRLLDEATTQ